VLTKRMQVNKETLATMLGQVEGFAKISETPIIGIGETFAGTSTSAIKARGEQIAELQKQMREDAIELQRLQSGANPFAGIASAVNAERIRGQSVAEVNRLLAQ